jgi:hypothetical protein
MASKQQAAGTAARAGSGGANVEAGLQDALRDVRGRLDKPGLATGERMRLLQRQAELGDLRDELALRARRRGI